MRVDSPAANARTEVLFRGKCNDSRIYESICKFVLKGDKPMIQEISVAENQVLVRLFGSICVEEAAQIREKLLGFIEKGRKTFILKSIRQFCGSREGLL